ncbi:MAG: hypothetical protein KTR32_35520 [Granulosicoccus sp.]|nr:hypothetical protein [Granulosicoccus sp.]
MNTPVAQLASVYLVFRPVIWSWLLLVSLVSIMMISTDAFANDSNVAPEQTANIRAINVEGPNQIEPTLFKVTRKHLSGESEQSVDIQWWPASCQTCVSNATINEQTNFQYSSGKLGEFWSLAIGKTYQANALIFENDSANELSVLVLID